MGEQKTIGGRHYDISISSSGVGDGRGMARGEMGDGVDRLVRSRPTGKGFRVCIRDIGDAATKGKVSVRTDRTTRYIYDVHRVLLANQRKVSLSWRSRSLNTSSLSIVNSGDSEAAVDRDRSISSTRLMESPLGWRTRALY